MTGIAVLGIGVLLPSAHGRDAFVRALREGRTDERGGDFRVTGLDLDRHFAGAVRFRRAASSTRYALAAAAMAVADAGLPLEEAAGERTGLVVSVTHGTIGYAVRFHEGLLKEGPRGASPLHFSESVLNAAAGNVSIALGIRGPVHTVVGEETAGVQAIGLAGALLRARVVDRCLVVGTEEREELVDRVYGELDASGGADAAFPPGEGSVGLLLARDDPSIDAAAHALLFPEIGAVGGSAGDGAEERMAAVVGKALVRAGRTSGDVGHVVLPTGRNRASGRRVLDRCLGESLLRIDPGAQNGNARGAAGVLQAAACACALAFADGAGVALTTGIEGTVAAVAARRAGRG